MEPSDIAMGDQTSTEASIHYSIQLHTLLYRLYKDVHVHVYVLIHTHSDTHHEGASI